MKTCTTCKTAKPLTGFAVDKRRQDGKNPQCRQCQYDAKKIKRDANKAKAIEYLGGKCKRCGVESQYHDIYDFHHTNPIEKEAEPSGLMYSSWNNIIKELDKCDLLCSNCHKITHWELRNKI
jgi:predicted HNH restriction endonuclease